MNRTKKNPTLAALFAVLLFALAVPAVLLVTGCGGGKPPASAGAKTYICPMHPEVVKDGKGSCPICGMDLVKKEEGASGGGAGDAGVPGFATVTIDARKRQLLSLRTAKVERGTFGTGIRTVGRVAYDERRVHHVHTRYEAYVEAIEADARPVGGG